MLRQLAAAGTRPRGHAPKNRNDSAKLFQPFVQANTSTTRKQGGTGLYKQRGTNSGKRTWQKNPVSYELSAGESRDRAFLSQARTPRKEMERIKRVHTFALRIGILFSSPLE